MIRAFAASLVLVLPVLAGCLSSDRASDPGGDPAAVPSSLDVDLHEFVLNITMPEGQPTVLVALNVTKDMWVRPFVAERPGAPTVPTHWILCVYGASIGLANGWGWVSLPLWYDDDGLRYVKDGPQGSMQSRVDGDDRCTNFVTSSRGAISSPEPLDGTLYLILAARPDDQRFPRTSDESSPAFRVHVGVARDPCQDVSVLCPPDVTRSAEPLARGGVPAWARFEETERLPCDDCGYVLHDNRTTVDAGANCGLPFCAVSTGSMVATRLGDIDRGFVVAVAYGGGEGNVGLVLQNEEFKTGVSCAIRHVGGTFILAAHTNPTTYRATFDMRVHRETWLYMLDIPMDPGVLPASLAPVAMTFGASGQECR